MNIVVEINVTLKCLNFGHGNDEIVVIQSSEVWDFSLFDDMLGAHSGTDMPFSHWEWGMSRVNRHL